MTDEQEWCCLCPKNKPESGTWICCDVCETWYHVRCLNMSPEEFEIIDQYHCAECTHKAGPSTLLRKSSRRTGKINYADLVNGIVSHHSKWRVLIESHQFLPDKFERIEGKDLTLEWLRATGFKSPVIVKRDQDGGTSGLDMKMPDPSLTVSDVRDAVGADTPVEVIDVATQSELVDWNLGAWADYFQMEPKERVYNVISLEITGTSLAEQVRRPKVVRELDWIENFWPKSLQQTEFPKVQLYCLMSVKDSFTDFHIDFAGSSVFYHILSGSKTFYFVEPTPTHLRKYAKWSSSSDQSTTFFGDAVAGKCHKVELEQGDTMLIPAGWIHAVYTPSSSMVIGGNFIHSLHVPMQYRICDIEIETNVSPKFRFPFFEKLNWFVALGALERGQDYLTTLSTKELQGILAVTVHLFNKQRSLKQDVQLIKEERHMIRASIPADATAYANGGVTGLLRDLNQLVLTILEGPGAIRTADSPIEPSLRIMTLEQEQREDEEERKNKPKIKLRIKLNSTASSTNSGDEESLEQQVPGSGASLRHTSASSPTSTNASATTTPTAVPKLKFKLPLLSVAKKPTKKSGRVPKPKKRSDTELYETGNESDLGDDKGEDIFGSDSDRDQQLTSDEEWNEFENQIDEGFDEAKEDEDEDDELEDDGSRADLRSSDSEYDEGVKRHRRSSSTKRMSRPAASSLRQAKKVTVQALTTTLRPHVKQSSSETVYFGEDGDGDYDGSPDYVYRPSKRESDEDEEEEVVLGLGKKRKLTPMQFSALIAPMSSVSGATNSSMTSSTPAKKKAAMGTTAKDRIKNLLMKRR